jgi:hypothetical protein
MTKWEYCRLTVYATGPTAPLDAEHGNLLSVVYYDNPPHTLTLEAEFPPVELWVLVDLLGSERWEAFSVNDAGSVWFFKRPVTE